MDTYKKPDGKYIISCKWILIIKNNKECQPTRYKARLFAKGVSQQYLQNYDETFVPVAKTTTPQFLLAFTNQFDLKIQHTK